MYCENILRDINDINVCVAGHNLNNMRYVDDALVADSEGQLQELLSTVVDASIKGSFYIAQYPVRRTAQSAVHFLPPGRPVHSDTNSASPGSIL